MKDEDKTTTQLVEELNQLRRRVAELESLEIERKQLEAKKDLLLAAEREQRALTEALHWAGAVLGSTLNYDKVLDYTMDQLGRVVSYNAACIMIIEAKNANIFRARGYHQENGDGLVAIGISDIPALRTVQETGWPLVIPYVTDRDEWAGLANQSWIKSSITVPLRTKNRLLGFLHVDSNVRGFYDQTDAERLHAFANQVAIALENAQRYDRARQEIARRVKDLKKERNFASTILNTVDALIVVLDARGRIIQFNRACERLTGYLLEEVTNKYVWDLFTPKDEIKQVKTRFKRLQKGQYPVTYESFWLTKDKEPHLISWSSTVLLNNNGEVEHIINTGVDITRRRQTEQEREKLIEELEAFAYTVAHDLQEPLGSIIGFADALLQYHSSMSQKELHETLQSVARNSQKMSNIIDELMLLTGVRKQEVVVKPLNMADILVEAERRLSYMIEEYKAQISKPAQWPTAIGYAPWIEEVWVNYLSNAIKYGGNPPRLELGATVQEDGLISFWVRDNGPGLTPEEQDRLFTPFTRLDKVRAKGHGLGLSIVRRIVEKLGGQVAVESDGEAGQGSKFSFTLPGASAF